jgi:DNA-binding protein H-NS
MVPEIASRRRSVSLVPVENMMLPAPLFPVYISEFQARSSPILQEIRAEQAALVREIDGNGFVEPSVVLADLPGGFSTAVALRERCEARGVKVPASMLLRFSNDRYGPLSFPVALKGSFVGADDIADALQPAKTIADAQQAARAWVVARHPSVEFSDAHLAKFSEILTPAQNAAFSARLQAIDMEEKAARADALNNGPDDEMVGITGNTFPHKDMIKEVALKSGEAAKFFKGPPAQWNVRRKVWKAIVEKNPGLVERGILVLTEYRGDGSASAGVSKQPEVAVRAGGTFPVKYRNPETGEMWSGRGLKPRWLIQALAAGRTLDEYLA